MQKKEIIASVRYNMFEKEQNSKQNSKHPFSQCKLFYSPDLDCYICLMVQEIHYIGYSKRKTASGFEQTSIKNQAKICLNCLLNGVCHKSKSD